MYELIADQYSRLFPSDKDRSKFIVDEISPTSKSEISILDAGCATGDLAFELAAAGCKITGIDLDSTMIEIARKRAESRNEHPTFKVRNLTEIEDLGTFNAITCFGNTLPHLPNETSVLDFFMKASAALSPEGRLIFQIINFDQLRDSNNFNFPDIDTGDSIFKRSYKRRTDGRLDFRISIENKESNKVIAEQTPLLPLMRKSLIEMLQKSGFSDIKVYSDYNRKAADGLEFANTYSTKKPRH